MEDTMTLPFRNKITGALLGQAVGDALGSQLEFQSAKSIELNNRQHLATDMVGSPVWGTIAGQLTDDTEMAIAVLESIIRNKGYDKDAALAGYQDWLQSGPFDCGHTIGSALRSGFPSDTSRSNGSMMRCSTIAAWGAGVSGQVALDALYDDATVTHADPVAIYGTVLYGMAIRYAIMFSPNGRETFDYVKSLATKLEVPQTVMEYISRAEDARPCDQDEGYQSGYCMVAFQHALHSLISGETFAESLTNTILTGGDTDTNAAIVGALLGSVVGAEAIPLEWRDCVMSCTPDENSPQPRPKRFHVSALMSRADHLIRAASY